MSHLSKPFCCECYISQGQCNWCFSSEARFFPSECHRLYFHVCAAVFLDFGFFCIFGVFKHSNYRAGKYLYLVHFAVSEMLLSGTALKKGAVCLASRDPTKLLVQESRLVNASKPLNKHQEDSSRLVSSLFTTFGEREQGTVTWTTKHLKQSKVCPSKSANKVRRSRKALRPRPLASTLFSTFANKIATLVRGTGAWSRPQGGGTWRRQRLAQTETGAQRLAQTGTETGAQRLAQTETGADKGSNNR